MNTLTLPRSDHDTAGGDDDVSHLWCCDPDVALCGLDIGDYGFVDADDEDPECPLCLYVYNEDLPCPVGGCTGGGS